MFVHGDSIAAVHDKRVLTGDLHLNLTIVIYGSIYKINDLNTGKIYNYIEKQHELLLLLGEEIQNKQPTKQQEC